MSEDLVHLVRGLTVELSVLVVRFARRHDLHPTDVRALILLLDAERAGMRASPGSLATELRLDSSSVTALVDRLVVAGHVAREAHPDDRRRVQLRATRRAVRLGEEFFGPVIAAMAVEMGTYSKRETAAITRFLRAMTDIASAAQRE